MTHITQNAEDPSLVLSKSTYEALIGALISAASKLTDLPELIDRNDIVIALGEIGNIWPDSINAH